MEEWRVVEGYSRYRVSSKGRVWDTLNDREMPQTWNGNFLCTNLIGDDNTKVLCKVHRLVAIAYVDNPTNASRVVHLDDDRSRNHYTNLFWKPKIVKEVIDKPVIKYEHLGKEYTVDDLSRISNVSIKNIRVRLKAGWNIREVLTGSKDFQGDGYQTDTMWFPTKEGLDRHLSKENTIKREREKVVKLQAAALARAEREATSHYGVGVFVNYPIKGIEGRRALKVYYVWQGIIARCYNPEHDSYDRYGGRGVTVHKDWHNFQNFAKWYYEQLDKLGIKRNDSYHVDKDILYSGNMEYGPKTCCVVPGEVNIFFSSFSEDNSCVYYEDHGTYRAAISISGKKYQKSFNSENDAVDWYKEGKKHAILLILWNYSGGILDERVEDKLREML